MSVTMSGVHAGPSSAPVRSAADRSPQPAANQPAATLAAPPAQPAPPAPQATLRLLVGHPCRLTGEVLAQSLGALGGIAAIKLVHGLDQLGDVAAGWHPTVTLLAGVSGPSPMAMAVEIGQKARCGVVVVATEPSRAAVDSALRAGNISLLSHHAALTHLVHAIRGAAMGCPTIDTTFVPTGDAATSSPLSDREREVLLMTSEGHPIKEIAAKLFLTPGTVRNISSSAIRKLDARNRYDAARVAHSKGWL